MMEEKVIDMSQTEVVGGKQYLPDPELAKLGDKVIDEFNIELGPAQVEYLLVYPNISKKKAAKPMTAHGLLKYYSGVDFFILISGEMWDMLDAETRKILVLHELLHCDARFKPKDQEWKYSIRKHDYADFYEITEKFGTNWYKTVQATVSSLYDMEPKQENEVTV